MATETSLFIDSDSEPPTLASFVFPEVVVPYGSTVTFSMGVVQGDGYVYYEVLTDTPNCPIIETNGTTPPLDTERRRACGRRSTVPTSCRPHRPAGV